MGTLVKDEYYFTLIHGIGPAAKETCAWTITGIWLPRLKKHSACLNTLVTSVAALHISMSANTMKRVLFVARKATKIEFDGSNFQLRPCRHKKLLS